MRNEPIEPGKAQDPYAPPASDADSVRAPLHEGAGQYGYRARGWLVTTVMGSLGLQALMRGSNAAACVALASRIGSEERLLSLSRFTVLVHPYIFYGGVVLFGIFLVDSNKNARAFVAATANIDDAPPEVSGDEPELSNDDEPARFDEDERPKRTRAMSVWAFSPASMVWWHFVPFLNLVRPYQAVKAVWASSASEHESRPAFHGNVLSGWWLAWLANFVVPRLRMIKLFGTFAARNLSIAIGDIVTVIACLLALRMVHALSERQRRRATELWA